MKKLTKNQKGVIVKASKVIADLKEKHKFEKELVEAAFVETCEVVLRKAFPLRTKFKKIKSAECGYFIHKGNPTYMITSYRVPNRFLDVAAGSPEEFLNRYGAIVCKKVDKLGRPNGYPETIWIHHFEKCCKIVK